jgi:hypothetical protein
VNFAKRFANTQITIFNQKLEQLHNEEERRSNSIGVNVAFQQPTNSPIAFAPHGLIVDAIGQATPAGGNSTGCDPLRLTVGKVAGVAGSQVNQAYPCWGAPCLIDHTLPTGGQRLAWL